MPRPRRRASFWKSPITRTVASFPIPCRRACRQARLKLLQKAFIDTLNDPALRAEAKRMRLGVDPIDGPATAKNVDKLYALEPELITRLKGIVLPKK